MVNRKEIKSSWFRVLLLQFRTLFTTPRPFFLGWALILSFSGFSQFDFQASDLQSDNGFTIPENYKGTSLEFGPDGRLYFLSLRGEILILTIERNGPGDYSILEMEELSLVIDIPNHNDDGSDNSWRGREATGLTVVGTPESPIIYVTSSDSRIGGPSGDLNLDTNSGVITRITKNGSTWEAVDMVRGLPRSEENHAANGLSFVSFGGKDYLLVCSGGNTNAGAPSKNFAWITEYALASAILIVDLSALEAMPVLTDGSRKYIYDLPTLDDPTRENQNGITDPDDPAYNGRDVGDPWGGNDGLNQAMIVPDGPVQIFSAGYRNAYDLVYTESGAVFVTDNGANGGWGGFPDQEGTDGQVTNNYRLGEPGSNTPDGDERKVNNRDHLSKVCDDISRYTWGSFYGGHPVPVRANPGGAGLFTKGSHSADPGDSNGNGYTDDWFRTVTFDPDGIGEAADPQKALPANWPSVPLSMADPRQGDYRNPGLPNPDGPDDALFTLWETNTNGIDEYTASNFNGALKGSLIAGKNGGILQLVQIDSQGAFLSLEPRLASGLAGNPLGVTCNSDTDRFPGSIWLATLTNRIQVLEPLDFIPCSVQEGEPDYSSPQLDSDQDGYTNRDEFDNGTDVCRVSSRPNDFDQDFISDRNDPDDDQDGIPDAQDPFQLGAPFDLPVLNQLLSEEDLGGYFNLGFTGFMNNGDTQTNWVDWVDKRAPDGESVGPNPNDLLGGAIGGITMQMTEGTAIGPANDQDKGLQLGLNVSASGGAFEVESRLDNFNAPLQLFGDNAQKGEGGIFIGDGTQSHFIQLVARRTGVEMRAELDDQTDTMLSAPYPEPLQNINNLTFFFQVEPSTGQIRGQFQVNALQNPDAPLVELGTVQARGRLREAIQMDSVPLAAGLIGSSHEAGKEVEVTWAYIHILANQPTLAVPLPDLVAYVGDPDYRIDLSNYFLDEGGAGQLTYTLADNSDPGIGVSLEGSEMRIVFPAIPSLSTVRIRATDQQGLYVEDEFEIAVTSASEVLYRINTGGPGLEAPDGGLSWVPDYATEYLVEAGSNFTSKFEMQGYDPSVDTNRVPAALYGSERSDAAGGEALTYSFPVANGPIEVRLYVGDGFQGTSNPGDRIFSVQIEDSIPAFLENIDLTARFGHQVGGMISYEVEVLDQALDIVFLHEQKENPLINGIEILGRSNGRPIATKPTPDRYNYVGDRVSGFLTALGGNPNENFEYSISGQPPGVSMLDPTTGYFGGNVEAGAEKGGPKGDGIYTVVWRVGKPSASILTETFTWIVRQPAETISVIISPEGQTDKITIVNRSQRDSIRSLVFDLSQTLLPDLIFDPSGLAGDGVGLCLRVDSLMAKSTGFVNPTDLCQAPFEEAAYGGFKKLTLAFDDFGPGDSLQFSVDVDPASLEGLTGVPVPGRISGLEWTGAGVEALLHDGGKAKGHIFPDGIPGGGRTLLSETPLPAPEIKVEGNSSLKDTLPVRSQTLTVEGTPGSYVALLQANAAWIRGGQASPGFSDSLFYANHIFDHQIHTAQLDSEGKGSFPVELFPTIRRGADPPIGGNYFLCVQTDLPYLTAREQVGLSSNILVLRYQPMDQDEDGVTDSLDNCPMTYNPDQWVPVYWLDEDNDGFGGSSSSLQACLPLPGYTANGGDCNDENADQHPGILDIPNDLVDQNCDGRDSFLRVNGVTLSSETEDFSWAMGETFTTRIQVSAGLQAFNRIRLALGYNPRLFALRSIQRGTELDSLTEQPSTDHQAGTFSFSAQRSKGILKGEAELARLTFEILSPDTTGAGYFSRDMGSNVWLADSVVLEENQIAFPLANITATEEIKGFGSNELRLFPNPTTGILHIQVDQGVGIRAQLRVLDLNGRPLYRQPVLIPPSEDTIGLDLKPLGLPNGLYILQFFSETTHYSPRTFLLRN